MQTQYLLIDPAHANGVASELLSESVQFKTLCWEQVLMLITRSAIGSWCIRAISYTELM